MFFIFFNHRSKRVEGAFCDIYKRLENVEAWYQSRVMGYGEKKMLEAELMNLARRLALEINIPIIRGYCNLSVAIDLANVGCLDMRLAHRLVVRKMLRLAYITGFHHEVTTILEQSLLHLQP